MFTRRRRRTLASDIADHVRRRIVSGELRSGQRLPSMKKLALLFGVSVSTIQSSIHVLASLGLVRVSHGNGTYVARPRSGAALLSYAVLHASVGELAELRAGIDQRAPVYVARAVAASRGVRRHRESVPRTIFDLNFLAGERALSRHLGPERFLRADLAFHAAILHAANGLEMLRELYLGIGERLVPTLLAASGGLAADRALDDSHRQLAAALLGGDMAVSARLARIIAQRELRALTERASLAETLG
jgi:DNA-binding FadR family transcriptional regulator